MKSKVTASIVVTILVVLGILFARSIKSSHHLSDSLAKSSAAVDSLKIISSTLVKKNEQQKEHIDSLETDTHHLKAILTKASIDLNEEDKKVITLTRSFEQMTEKCNGFLILQKQWGNEQNRLISANTKLTEDIKHLMAEIAVLSQTNRQLSNELSLAKLFEKDNILIARLDKNDRPNVNAKKIKKIKVSMSLPSEIKSPEFKIIDSSGKVLSTQSGSFTSHFSKETNVFGAEATRLELTYSLTQRVSSGAYRVEIANDGKHIGSLLMNFR